MKTLRQTKMEGWLEYYREECPICHKTGGCIRNIDGDMVGCIRIESNKVFSKSPMTWLHILTQKQEKVTSTWVQGVKKRDDEQLNFIYRNLIHQRLTLTQFHLEKMKYERGLSEEEINVLGYKSINNETTVMVPKGLKLSGIPGFYKQNDKYHFVRANGILIPYRNEYNEIVGYQVRQDVIKNFATLKNASDSCKATVDADNHSVTVVNGDGEIIFKKRMEVGEELEVIAGMTVKLKAQNKYYWISSANKEEGCGPGAPVHVSYDWARVEAFETDIRSAIREKNVWITEGAVKGDIAHAHMKNAFTQDELNKIGDTFLSVAGVTSWANLLPVLENIGAEQVTIAFDMDMLANEYVKNAVSQLLAALKEKRYTINYASWSQNDGKGIDDVLLNSKRPKVRRINY
ncbi:DUF3854 domain-containing protein [Solibacillus silvestris]